MFFCLENVYYSTGGFACGMKLVGSFDSTAGQNKLIQYIQMIQKQVFQLKEMRLTYCFISFSRIRTIRLMSKLLLFFKQFHDFHLFESTRHP